MPKKLVNSREFRGHRGAPGARPGSFSDTSSGDDKNPYGGSAALTATARTAARRGAAAAGP